MSTEYETLFDIFNDINISINNNLCIKDKIIKKIDIIKNLSNYNIDILNFNNDKKSNLFNILNSLNYKLTSIKKNQNKLNTKLNNILGIIIHNTYITCEYQVLLSNIPNSAKQILDDKLTNINSEIIYDTIEHYIGKDTVLNVIQIDSDKYLAKFNNNNDAEKLCTLIHKMLIEQNIIKAEILKNDTDTDSDSDTNTDINTDTDTDTDTNTNIDTNIDTVNITVIDKDIYKYFKNEIEYNTIKNNNINNKFNDNSLFSICINLVYVNYKYYQYKIKNKIQYVYSFFSN